MDSIGLVLKERYEIIAEIGRGGMSTVYLAKDRELGSYWAIKKVVDDGGKDILSFRKEVALLSCLNHSDIPRIVDRIEHGREYFVVMDFVDGVSLGKKVLAEGSQKEADVVEWAKMLCEVLDYLHTVKDDPIVYCDLKPDNIMLSNSGRTKLIDFGIAKECPRGKAYEGEAVGTKGYAAPEQYRGADNILDERTDVYSFGASLFYILTGVTPKKPPNGVKPLREVDPELSEGIDYIVDKCTRDDPAERYANFREVLQDLKCIDELTSSYRRKMRNRLLGFYAASAACVLCLIPAFIGYSGVQKQKEDNYRFYYQKAAAAIQNEDYETAAQDYASSISYRPELTETYLLYFNSMLPRKNDDNYLTLTKNAIDIMRNSYIDNRKSVMHDKPDIAYQVMRKCIEVNDPAYAEYALKYIELLKSNGYKEQELKYFEILAMNCSQNLAVQDFDKFAAALADLEEYTDNTALSAEDKLENYYAIMKMYSEYTTYLPNAYDNVYNIGKKAKDIIDSNIGTESLAFSGIIPMYELTASALYNSGIIETEKNKKNERFTAALEWYGYLSDLNDDLSEILWLKKANAFRNLYSFNSDPSYLEDAIAEFDTMLKSYPSSFSARVYLSMSYLDAELAKSKENRDYSDALSSYEDVIRMKNENKNLSSSELSQFSSLKQAYINAALIKE